MKDCCIAALSPSQSQAMLKFHPLRRGSGSLGPLATSLVWSSRIPPPLPIWPLLLICRLFSCWTVLLEYCIFCFLEVWDGGWYFAPARGAGQASFGDQWQTSAFKWNLTQYRQTTGAKHSRESGGITLRKWKYSYHHSLSCLYSPLWLLYNKNKFF